MSCEGTDLRDRRLHRKLCILGVLVRRRPYDDPPRTPKLPRATAYVRSLLRDIGGAERHISAEARLLAYSTFGCCATRA